MILYFSGTGNSRLVATELQKLLAADNVGKLYELAGERLLRPGQQLIEVAPEELVVWVFPVYSWGVPPVVLRFIDKMKFKGMERCRHYMVCTCGDDVGRADDMWRKHLGRRGCTPRGAFSVQMPNTYVCMKGFDVDSEEVESAKLRAMPARLVEIVAKIRRGYADSDVVRGSWAWAKTNLVYPLFRAFRMSPLPFRADPQRCISCGKCARNCPLENITMKEDGSGKELPQWGPVCTMCLRCYHQCPNRTIAWGKATEGKGQYHIDDHAVRN